MIEIIISDKAKKDLKKIPGEIELKLYTWVDDAKENGMAYVRTINGYNDKPLFGKRKGQRSIRLNYAYRAFYIETSEGEIEIVTIIEVNKHDY
ncbi:MAG: type II toxin-antitoxin system RelE/ParE family toxin [Gammaproteobacteria bacterium]|nr:type II toxin-antitoxin system RelE/ParE family toxin [Gammaproteobacteria bacterium]